MTAIVSHEQPRTRVELRNAERRANNPVRVLARAAVGVMRNNLSLERPNAGESGHDPLEGIGTDYDFYVARASLGGMMSDVRPRDFTGVVEEDYLDYIKAHNKNQNG